ncbi:PAS domain S-box protein [Pedobacter vanadiisoli]|uniref:histidine kinase n=1 Tax=Pedobacter vanadiisoli TaxID=1761975 RepID=A0ABW5MJK2_9SPHI
MEYSKQLFTFKSIFDGMEDAVICHDLDFSITHWNPAAEILFGYNSIEADGASMNIIMDAGYFEEQHQMINEILKGVKIDNFHSVRKTRTGKDIHVAITISPISDEDGNIAGASQIIRDISREIIAEQQQATLAAIIEGSDDAIISTTVGGIITSWNKGAQAIFGYAPSEVIGRHMALLLPADRRHEEDMINSKVSRDNKTEHFQTVHIAKNGALIPVSLTVSPVRNKNGDVIGTSKIARNITAQKLADEKRATLAAIVESSDDAIISKTLEGIIITWNKAAEHIFGYTENEAVGCHISILIPNNRLDEEDRIISSIRSGKKIDHYQTIRIRKDGKEIPIALTVSPILSSDGTVIGASKIVRDITAAREAEIAMENNSQKLLLLNSIGKSISEQMDVNVILQKVTDATTKLTGAAFGAFFYNKLDENRESYMLFTLSGAQREAFEKFGMPKNTALFHPTFSGLGVVRVDDVTTDPRYGKMAPHFGMPEGHLPVRSYLAVPVISASGAVTGGLFFGHPEPGVFLEEHEDIVVSIASQAAIALDNSKLFEEVSALSRKKDEFIALASHELKTPLTSMSGFLQILQKTMVTEGLGKKFLEKSIHQLEKLNRLVNDLFDISKVQAGKMQFFFEHFDLGELLEEVCDTFRQSMPGRTFACNLENDLLIYGDKMRLEQVIINLINNAVKYAPNSSQVNILAVKNHTENVISVTDYGIGISKADQQNIFSQFYRVRDRDQHVSGLGLGLFITKEIVERHKGRIWVESERGKGATFIFTIPHKNEDILIDTLNI